MASNNKDNSLQTVVLRPADSNRMASWSEPGRWQNPSLENQGVKQIIACTPSSDENDYNSCWGSGPWSNTSISAKSKWRLSQNLAASRRKGTPKTQYSKGDNKFYGFPVSEDSDHKIIEVPFSEENASNKGDHTVIPPQSWTYAPARAIRFVQDQIFWSKIDEVPGPLFRSKLYRKEDYFVVINLA